MVGEEAGASSSADEQSSNGLLRDVLMAFLPALGVLAGCVLGWYASTWAVQSIRDVLEVPELSPIPVQDRAPGVPGPTVGYWFSWALPFVTAYGVGALLLWRWRRGRLLTGAVLVGFSIATLFIVPTWISIEVGGFGPR